MSIITAATYQAILGEVIVQERKAKKLSQGELAAQLGISQSAWSRVETGLTNISIEQLVKVAKALNTQPHKLIERADRTKAALEFNNIRVTEESKPNDEGWLLLGAAALAAIILSSK